MSDVKKERRNQAVKKAKRKRTIKIILAGAGILLAVAAVIITIILTYGSEYYAEGGQSLRLHSDGTFTAILYHEVSYSGTYERVENGVNLTYGEITPITVFSHIENKLLTLPTEWDDFHGHQRILPKR